MGKKEDVLQAAVSLFARQGFDATTTLEIATTAGATEPVIYYHFKNKDGLFTHILGKTFNTYFSRLDALDKDTPTQFQKLESLIDMHFRFVDEFPDQTYIIVSACPAKLRESAHICAQYIEAQRQRLAKYISACLEKGVESGEFTPISVEGTTGLLIALVNGLLRRRGLKLDQIEGLKAATVDFCRRSLVKNE
jgi:AcrR family transcriptional regulator